MKSKTVEDSRKRRGRLYIIADILNIARDGSLKTQIMYRANLSFSQLNEYLSFLTNTNLLKVSAEKEKKIYRTTEKGIRYLKNYGEIRSLLSADDDCDVRVNSPIFVDGHWLKRKPTGH